MKTATYGRRFSRRVRTSYESFDEFAAHSIGSAPQPNDALGSLIAHNVEAARERLKLANLPGDAVVREANDACTIEHFVTRVRGFDEDSTEGLAARIVSHAHALANASGPQRDALLWALAQAVLLARVYETDGRAARKAASGPRARKLPATIGAEYAELVDEGRKRYAAGLLAKRHGTTQTAIRAALKKKSKT